MPVLNRRFCESLQETVSSICWVSAVESTHSYGFKVTKESSYTKAIDSISYCGDIVIEDGFLP
jgi:hypothetical protein